MMRWWGIRHVRWFRCFCRFYEFAYSRGGYPRARDLEVLDQIWRGEL